MRSKQRRSKVPALDSLNCTSLSRYVIYNLIIPTAYVIYNIHLIYSLSSISRMPTRGTMELRELVRHRAALVSFPRSNI